MAAIEMLECQFTWQTDIKRWDHFINRKKLMILIVVSFVMNNEIFHLRPQNYYKNIIGSRAIFPPFIQTIS